MMRLRLHKLPNTQNDTSYEIRLTCGAVQRIKRIRYLGNKSEESYNLYKAIIETQRDALYAKYGSKYRFVQAANKKSLVKSMISAVKRMK